MVAVTKAPTVALALAGGSFRAASTCAGILRGLHQKTVINHDGKEVPAMHAVKYNSGISGGAIPATLYTFAQVPTDELLETHLTYHPEELTLEDLQRRPPENSYGNTLIFKKPGLLPRLWTNLNRPSKIIFWLVNFFKIHSWWSGFMYNKLCAPLKMPRNKLFTSSPQELEKILAENPKLKASDFLLPRSDVKTMPLILWTMHGARADLNTFMNNYYKIKDKSWTEFVRELNLDFFSGISVDQSQPNMTDILLNVRDENHGNLPLPFLGTPDSVSAPYEGKVILRRNTINFPLEPVKPHLWGTRTRFSIETMMAMSANFVGSGGANGMQAGLVAQFMANVRKLKLDDKHKDTLLMADGGTNDLFGILPAIHHGATEIICVYNFNQNPPYAQFNTSYADIYEKAPCTARNDAKFEAYFREWLKMMNPRLTAFFGYYGPELISHSNLPNHVFHDPDLDQLKNLMVTYNSLYEAGEPLVATMEDMETLTNPFWGIKSGQKVSITMMWFNLPRKFAENVPKELGLGLDDRFQFTNEDLGLKNFPELLNDPVSSVGYNPVQINLMSCLGSWIVHRAWDGLTGHDGKEKFKGLGKILNAASTT